MGAGLTALQPHVPESRSLKAGTMVQVVFKLGTVAEGLGSPARQQAWGVTQVVVAGDWTPGAEL